MTRPRSLALALALALAAGTASPRRARGEDDPVAAAEALLAGADAGKAVEAFRALAERPGGGEDARVQAGLGAALVRAGDRSAALAPLWVAAKKRGTTADHLVLAETLLAVGEERMEGARRSIDVVPYLHDAVAEAAKARAGATEGDAALRRRAAYAEGRARWHLGDAAAARTALSDPSLSDDPVALDLLARAAWAERDYAAAARAWERVPNPRGVATAWAAAKDPRATAAYAKLLEQAPGDRALLEEAAGAAVRVGDAAGLDAALERLAGGAGTTSPTRFELQRARGLLMERAKRPADAVPRYRAALAEKPDDAGTSAALGRALLFASPDDAAARAESVRLLLGALRAEPEDRTTRDDLAWVAAKDWEAAPAEWPDRARLSRCVEVFRALAETAPEDAAAWAEYGNALRLSGDPAAAVAAYDKAVALNPFDASLANDRGLAVLAAGDVPAAIAAFAAATVVDPRDTSPRQNLARLHWLRGEDDQASAHLAAALSAARASRGKPLLYRFLIDRVWRAKTRPEVR